jgi:hypothetical protein
MLRSYQQEIILFWPILDLKIWRVKHQPLWHTTTGQLQAKYGKNTLEKALAAVMANKMNAREAAKYFGVPRATLGDRLAGWVKDTLRRPTELSHTEETIIVEHLLLLGTWGFPYTLNDLPYLIKDYLDMQGGLQGMHQMWKYNLHEIAVRLG